jgi:hypothetical protein
MKPVVSWAVGVQKENIGRVHTTLDHSAPASSVVFFLVAVYYLAVHVRIDRCFAYVRSARWRGAASSSSVGLDLTN